VPVRFQGRSHRIDRGPPSRTRPFPHCSAPPRVRPCRQADGKSSAPANDHSVIALNVVAVGVVPKVRRSAARSAAQANSLSSGIIIPTNLVRIITLPRFLVQERSPGRVRAALRVDTELEHAIAPTRSLEERSLARQAPRMGNQDDAARPSCAPGRAGSLAVIPVTSCAIGHS
jgi:hypothetical protein